MLTLKRTNSNSAAATNNSQLCVIWEENCKWIEKPNITNPWKYYFEYSLAKTSLICSILANWKKLQQSLFGKENDLTTKKGLILRPKWELMVEPFPHARLLCLSHRALTSVILRAEKNTFPSSDFLYKKLLNLCLTQWDSSTVQLCGVWEENLNILPSGGNSQNSYGWSGTLVRKTLSDAKFSLAHCYTRAWDRFHPIVHPMVGNQWIFFLLKFRLLN